MNKTIRHFTLLSVFTVLAGLSGPAYTQQAEPALDIHAGHFSREGNNGSPSETSHNNIYIKLYPDNWIALLYVPFPYAKNVSADIIDKVFVQAKTQITKRSFTRDTFGLLDEAATVHMERYEQVEGQTQFECGSINPCALRFGNDYLELVKSGVINEHIVKFNHITE